MTRDGDPVRDLRVRFTILPVKSGFLHWLGLVPALGQGNE